MIIEIAVWFTAMKRQLVLPLKTHMTGDQSAGAEVEVGSTVAFVARVEIVGFVLKKTQSRAEHDLRGLVKPRPAGLTKLDDISPPREPMARRWLVPGLCRWGSSGGSERIFRQLCS